MDGDARRSRWRRWVFFTGPSAYPPRVQVICTLLIVAWTVAWIGIPYAAGITWPWRYARVAGPVLVLVLYVPMVSWLNRHGYYDEGRIRRFYDDE